MTRLDVLTVVPGAMTAAAFPAYRVSGVPALRLTGSEILVAHLVYFGLRDEPRGPSGVSEEVVGEELAQGERDLERVLSSV